MIVSEVYEGDTKRELNLPLAESACPAGFPSPAEDHMEQRLDLNDHLIDHPAATYFVRVSGESMVDAGIHDGDLLVVDRAEEPTDGDVVVAALDGQLTVKRLQVEPQALVLRSENDDYEPIRVSREAEFRIWGVVNHVVHSL